MLYKQSVHMFYICQNNELNMIISLLNMISFTVKFWFMFLDNKILFVQ